MQLAAIGIVPGLMVSIYYILWSDTSIYLQCLLLLCLASSAGFSCYAIRQYAITQLRTSTNIVEAIVTGDYTLRANIRDSKGVLTEFNGLLNALTERLSQQRLISREQQILLTKIIGQIDVAIVAYNQRQAITLINPAAERLFDVKQHDIVGWPLKQLGLHPILEKDLQHSVQIKLPHHREKVLVKKDTYLENGEQNTLVFITHIQDILREEERNAWQRLLRVLSHEINNSLAPIASIAETLTSMETMKDVIKDEYKDNFVSGLHVIQERAHSLNDFIHDYHKLAKLPAPQKQRIDVKSMLPDITALFSHVTFAVTVPEITLVVDKEQLQQVFINLIKNADEANKLKHDTSFISVTMSRDEQTIAFSVTDNGPGIKNPDNLFIPYYSTKKSGSGIGLVLCRQIIRNHNGELTLQNKPDEQGVIATIRLPLSAVV